MSHVIFFLDTLSGVRVGEEKISVKLLLIFEGFTSESEDKEVNSVMGEWEERKEEVEDDDDHDGDNCGGSVCGCCKGCSS